MAVDKFGNVTPDPANPTNPSTRDPLTYRGAGQYDPANPGASRAAPVNPAYPDPTPGQPSAYAAPYNPNGPANPNDPTSPRAYPYGYPNDQRGVVGSPVPSVDSHFSSAIIGAVDAIDKAMGELTAASQSHVISPVGAATSTAHVIAPDALYGADGKVRAATQSLKDAVAKMNSRPANDPNWHMPQRAYPAATAAQAAGRQPGQPGYSNQPAGARPSLTAARPSRGGFVWPSKK